MWIPEPEQEQVSREYHRRRPWISPRAGPSASSDLRASMPVTGKYRVALKAGRATTTPAKFESASRRAGRSDPLSADHAQLEAPPGPGVGAVSQDARSETAGLYGVKGAFQRQRGSVSPDLMRAHVSSPRPRESDTRCTGLHTDRPETTRRQFDLTNGSLSV
jgi:hypothetical protein